MQTARHFEQTADFEHPKIRWFNGHFITAEKLREIQEEGMIG